MLNWRKPRPTPCGHPPSRTRMTAPELRRASRWLEELPPCATSCPEPFLILYTLRPDAFLRIRMYLVDPSGTRESTRPLDSCRRKERRAALSTMVPSYWRRPMRNRWAGGVRLGPEVPPV